MPRIKDASKDAVIAAADMVDVVSAKTALRRASSARYTGRCPFHEERTPSFSVDPVGKLYYCFGCGKGGDVVRFVQESENLDFVGALEWLDRVSRRALPHHARVRGVLAEGGCRTPAAGAPDRAARAGDLLLRADVVGVGGGRFGAGLRRVARSRRNRAS